MLTSPLLAYRVTGTTSVCTQPHPAVHRHHQATSQSQHPTSGARDDLLVVGYGGRSRLGYAVHGAVTRYCLAHARCPVLTVPPPELIREVRPRRHHWRPEDFAVPWPDSRTDHGTWPIWQVR